MKRTQILALLLAISLAVVAPLESTTMHDQEKEFLEHIQSLGSQKYNRLSLEEFLVRNIKVRAGSKVVPYSFAGRAWLRDMTRTLHSQSKLIFLKPAQVMISTWMIGRTFWKLDGTSLNAVCYFPDQTAMKEFVQFRVNPIVENSKYLSELQSRSSVDNVGLKRFGAWTFAFRASSTMTGVKSFDADLIIKDESDEHDPENAAFIEDRILNSELGWYMSGSQPSIPNFGIHSEFEETDQLFFHLKCACGFWTDPVNWYLELAGEEKEKIFKIQKGRVDLACRKCGRALDHNRGEYVPRFQDRQTAGVQISHLYAGSPLYTPAKILEKMRGLDTSLKRKNFTISIIGWPYSTDEEKPITVQVLDQFRSDYALQSGSQSFTYMGADQGDTVHMVFGEPTADNRIRITGLEKFHVLEEERQRACIQNFNVFRAYIDAMPNKNWALKTALRFPDRIGIQYFAKLFAYRSESTPPSGIDATVHSLSDESDGQVPVLKVNRDDSLQDTVDAIKNGLFIFPAKARLDSTQLKLLEEFEYHLTMLVRERTEDGNGKPLYRFKKKVPNHYGMALNSLRLAVQSSDLSTHGSGGLIL